MADRKIFVVGDVAYSREGLEGILGYNPAMAFATYEAARTWAEQNLGEYYLSKPGLELVWKTDPDDETTTILYVSYLEEHREYVITSRSPSGLAVVGHYQAVEQVRTSERDVCVILQIDFREE